MNYIINEDGTVTRKNHAPNDSPPPPPTGGSEDNNGCWIFIIISIIVGILSIVVSNNNSSSFDNEISADTIAPEKVDENNVEEDIYEAPEAAYINISAESVSFEAEGGSYTFTVNSNYSWEISTNTYDWGHLYRSGNELTLIVDENPNFSLRTDYFQVKAKDTERTVNIIQNGRVSKRHNPAKVFGSIRQIWVEHNVSDSYENKGMRIHVKFDISGMLNTTGQVAAYFFNSDGEPLKDSNGICRTIDGDVATDVDFTPNYENCTFNDFIIFMPYSEMHLNRSTSCFFFIIIWDGNKEVAQSDDYFFDVTY